MPHLYRFILIPVHHILHHPVRSGLITDKAHKNMADFFNPGFRKVLAIYLIL